MKTTIQNILSSMRRAITKYAMIEDGDKIAVGLSGGKDSSTLLAALNLYRRFSPQKFSLVAITVDLGLGADYAPLQKWCKSLDIEYRLEKTDIGDIIFNHRKEKNPCSLCSKMRRGALNTVLKEMGCNKLALGHHADDAAETFLLSLFYEGRFSTFAPVSFMDRSCVTMIRPLIFTLEEEIIAVSKDFPVIFNPCPADHQTRREYMKELLKTLSKDIPSASERLMSAIFHPERNNLWDKLQAEED